MILPNGKRVAPQPPDFLTSMRTVNKQHVIVMFAAREGRRIADARCDPLNL